MRRCPACGTLHSGDSCPGCAADRARGPGSPRPGPVEEPPLQPGQSFHGLEVVELLGRGGMGFVFKARQPALDRLVALKVLPKEMALDPDFQGRFAREAKALASLSHPNIVGVYDFGAEGGLFFLSMEYVDGIDLRRLLREPAFSPEEAFKIVPQLCDALEYAHGEGIVHRDIKPGNILIDKKGRVKIADFGLAKLVGRETRHPLTQTDAVMGTPHYMAPEQVENPRAVDHRADIYSMGVVFYEMLTRELPIGRFEVPSRKAPVDVRLDDIVLRALEKQPDRRYQHASEVKTDVTRVTRVPAADPYAPTVITPPSPRRPWRPMNLGALAALAIGIAVIGYLVVRRTLSPAPAHDATRAAGKGDPTSGPDRGMRSEIPAAVNLEKLYFNGDESPAGYPLLKEEAIGGRNPLSAKDPAEIEQIVKRLDQWGLPNISARDVNRGYAISWWSCAMVALDSPASETLEKRVRSSRRLDNGWCHRDGNLLVVVIATNRAHRIALNDAVRRVRSKLGLLPEELDVPLENVVYADYAPPTGWELARKRGAIELPCLARSEAEIARVLAGFPGLSQVKPPEVRGAYAAAFQPIGGAPELYYTALEMQDVTVAEELRVMLSEARESDWPGVRKVEALRTGRTVTALFGSKNALAVFERVAQDLRQWMGLPKVTLETLTPRKEDVPEAFAIESVEEDSRKLFEKFGLPPVAPTTRVGARLVTFKPAAWVLLLEVDDEILISKLVEKLRERWLAWRDGRFICAVEGSNDIEDMMRDKFAEDRRDHR